MTPINTITSFPKREVKIYDSTPNWNQYVNEPIWQTNFTSSSPAEAPVIQQEFNPGMLLICNFSSALETLTQWWSKMFPVKLEPIFPMALSFENSPAASSATTQNIKQNSKPATSERAMFDKFMVHLLEDENTNFHMDGTNPCIAGIQKKWYDANMGKTTTIEDFKAELSNVENQKEYYYKFYWAQSGAKKLAEQGKEKLAYMVFDTAVHSGFGRAKKLLKESNYDADKMLALRTDFLKGLNNGKSWANNGGWATRMENIDTRMDAMA